MTDYVLKVESGTLNFSAYGFRRSAHQFMDFFDNFKPPEFSIVPYFLCSRSIELGLKAQHLESLSQLQIKNRFSHNLVKLYRSLPKANQNLNAQEEALLTEANKIYSDKHFEYIQPIDA